MAALPPIPPVPPAAATAGRLASVGRVATRAMPLVGLGLLAGGVIARGFPGRAHFLLDDAEAEPLPATERTQ